MKQLYNYCGTVSSISFDSRGCGTTEVIIGDISDWDKPSVRVAAYGALAKYICEIEMTDAEERYITSEWYYDRNLLLHRIIVPSNSEYIPAKVITPADYLSNELVIFGPKEHIETGSPEPMDKDQSAAWHEFRFHH